MNALERRRPAPKTSPKVRAVAARPSVAPVVVEPAPAPMPPRAFVTRAEAEARMSSQAVLDFESVASTAMFSTLGNIRALAVREASSAIVRRNIAEARGYSDSELYALAEIGYHYFRNGGLKLALVIFEGLQAVKPQEPYFALATGLARDYLGDKNGAKAAYQEAARLDVGDARPELNLAELCLEAGDRRAAIQHLNRAAQKAEARKDRPLLKKAQAVLSLVR